MQIIKDVTQWQEIRNSIMDKKLGFVATLGNLHDGHASLINKSVLENDITILSIFLNPTQFNNPQDLLNYPKTIDADIKLAESLQVDYLLCFEAKQLYPDNYNYKVTENSAYGASMENEFRPNHFTGMLTIVLKLLLLTRPTKTYFGEKDYQQLTLVKGLVEAFLLETEVIACPTIRNNKGFPLSSRNNLLTQGDLDKASIFSELLSSNLSADEIKQNLSIDGFIVDYITEYENRIYGAVWLNGIRLIDNIRREI
jgi:pantoate--beta-alanine ligase